MDWTETSLKWVHATTPPQTKEELLILYKPRKNSKPQMAFAYWCPDNDEGAGIFPVWENVRESTLIHPDKVTHYAEVKLPTS